MRELKMDQEAAFLPASSYPDTASTDGVQRWTSRSDWFRIAAWSLFWLVTLGGTGAGLLSILRDSPEVMHDFVVPYSAAKCLLLGCDPYDSEQVHQTFAAAGGQRNDRVDWQYTPPVYPPSTLVELVPFAIVNYHLARIAWFLFSAAAFIASFVLWAGLLAPAYRPWMALLGVLLRVSDSATFATEAGQASLIASGLTAIGLWCFIRGRYNLAGCICLGLAMGLKPQLAGVVLLYLILRPVFRWSAVKAAAIAFVLLLAGVAWLSLTPSSKQWRSELNTQVEASQQPGAINDPSDANRFSPDMVNAQAAWVTLTRNPATYNLLAYLLFAALLIPFAIRAWGGAETNTRMFVALGAIVCIGMLPVYHRMYDLLILLVAFPSLIYFFVERYKLRWIAACAMCVALIPGPIINRIPAFHSLNFYWHFQALAVIALAVTYLAAMFGKDDECEAVWARGASRFH